MTFSALSYIVWYKKQRRFIKDMIDANDFAGATTRIQNLIDELENKIPNDHSFNLSELKHLRHALNHINSGTDANSAPETIQRLTRIFLYEPDAVEE